MCRAWRVHAAAQVEIELSIGERRMHRLRGGERQRRLADPAHPFDHHASTTLQSGADFFEIALATAEAVGRPRNLEHGGVRELSEEPHGLGTARDPELLEQAPDVDLHGIARDAELAGDL